MFFVKAIQRWLGGDRRRSRSRPQSFRPQVESLEERRVLSTFTVTNTNDAGAGSLRQAITDANAHANVGESDQIVFKFAADDPNHFYYKNNGTAGSVNPTQATKTSAADDAANPDPDPDYRSSWWSIRLKSALPPVTDPAIIDGYSQSGAQPNGQAVGNNAILRVELTVDQTATAIPDAGLTLRSPGNTVKGLAINRFGTQVLVDKDPAKIVVPNNNSVEGNFLGTEIAGLVAGGKATSGVYVEAGANNVIGGTSPAARNVISGNTNNGVSIRSQDTSVQGNYIGSDRTGNKAVANFTGAFIFGLGPASNVAFTNNLISGNTNGVQIGSKDVRVQGNLIGTTADGNRALPNTFGIFAPDTGAVIGGASATGGPSATEGNVIAASTLFNVFVSGSNNTVQGNVIGLAADGHTKLVSQRDAVVVTPATAANNQITNNTIAANTGFQPINDSGTGTVKTPNAIVP